MKQESKGMLLSMQPKKWANLPLERIPPFAQSVRLVIESTTRLTAFLLKNHRDEIDRELSPERSVFLFNLKKLLQTELRPDKTTLSILSELKNCFELLKVALKKHFPLTNSCLEISGINKLIKEICERHNFDNNDLKKDIYLSCCTQLKALKTRSSPPAPNDHHNETAISHRENNSANSNVQIADEKSKQEMKHSNPILINALSNLKAIVEDACKNSKTGEFLFTRNAYKNIINDLWEKQTDEKYHVYPNDASLISSLWLSIRTGIIKYAKAMVTQPSHLIKDLSNERCWMLFPKFTLANETPHVLDAITLKELFSTLTISETPRKTIKPETNKKVIDDNKPTQEEVDIDSLPQKDYRFSTTKDYRVIVDHEHTSPDYAINPYLSIPPTASKIIKTLISAAKRRKNEGWIRPEKKWHTAFQSDVAGRFKKEQIQIEKRNGNLSYWRIIPNEEFHSHYNCKIKPRPITF